MEVRKVKVVHDSNNLRKGINIIYDMELNRVMMTRLFNSLKNTINRMDFSSRVVPPTKPEYRLATLDNAMTGKVTGIAGCIGLFIGMLTSCSASGNYENSIFGTMGRIEDSIGNGFLGGILGFAIGALIGFFIGYFIDKAELQNVEAYNEAKYRRDCEEYQKKYKEYEASVEAEKAQLALRAKKRDALIQQGEMIREQYTRTTSMLANFYNLLNIDPKFRNIHPLGYMCEFINLGVSEKLEGADGLYYLVLKELRYDQMQYTLDEISSKLDTIIDNQRAMYAELREMNYTADKIHNAVFSLVAEARNQTELQKHINEKSEVNNYVLQRIACEQEYQSQMMIISNLIHN